MTVPMNDEKSRHSQKKINAIKRLENWRSKYASDLTNEDVDEFIASLEQMRAASKSRPNPFLDETFFN